MMFSLSFPFNAAKAFWFHSAIGAGQAGRQDKMQMLQFIPPINNPPIQPPPSSRDEEMLIEAIEAPYCMEYGDSESYRSIAVYADD